MNLNPFTWFARKSAAVVSLFGGKGVVWSERTAKTYAAEGYQKCVIVFRCVDIISKSLAAIPLRLYRGDKEVTKHPIIDLLNRPNPSQSYGEFSAWAVAMRLLTGNSYVERIFASGNKYGELWCWMPYSMKIEEHKKASRLPMKYIYDDGQADNKREWLVDPITGACDLLQWKTFNPLDPWYGLSPLAAASMSVDQHNEANAWNMKLLQNNAMPSGALVAGASLSDPQFTRLKKELEDNYQGSKNARKPLLLEGGLDWKQFSLSPADLDWLEGKNVSGREIAAAFGVPTQVIPLMGDQTFANYEQARLALWQDTVVPLASDWADSLTRWLAPIYGEDFRLEPDTDAIPALEPVRAQKWTAIAGADFLTINEKRERLGFEPLPSDGADQVYIPASSLPLEDSTEEATGEQPTPTTSGGAAVPVDATLPQVSLNGAQIASLLAIIAQVVAKQLPPEAAISLITVSFPTISPEEAHAIIDPLKSVEAPEPVAAPTAGKPGEPAAPPEEDEEDMDEEATKKLLKAQLKALGLEDLAHVSR